jgi:hypothetical protein
MAKRRKALPARPSTDGAGEEHSLLLRSAESLGRVIGALQRQLDDATKRLSLDGHDGASQMENASATPRPSRRAKPAKTAAPRNGASASRNGGKKKQAAARKAVARKPAATKRKRAATRH